jgi:uncharacterized membrane protein
MKKNAALAIEAFAILRKKNPSTSDVRVVLAGQSDMSHYTTSFLTMFQVATIPVSRITYKP